MLPLPLVCALLCLFGAWLCRELRAYYAVPAPAWYERVSVRTRGGGFVLIAWGRV